MKSRASMTLLLFVETSEIYWASRNFPVYLTNRDSLISALY